MLRLLPLAGVVLALLPAAAGAAECPVAPDPAARAVAGPIANTATRTGSRRNARALTAPALR